MQYAKLLQLVKTNAISILCSGISLLMFISLFNDYKKSIFLPIPYDYGEGVTVWMAREISEGKMPYGDIETTPSRYSAYGPLFPSLIAALSHVIPNNPNPPISIETSPDSSPEDRNSFRTTLNLEDRFIIIGRGLNALFWLLTGFALGLLTGSWKKALLLAPIPALACSELFIMYSCRIDSMVIFLQACILLMLKEQKRLGTHLLLLLPITCVALTLTKPTALIDILPITGLAFCLGNTKFKEFFSNTFKSLSISAGASLLAFFIVNMLCSGWLLNNIFIIQPQSGWAMYYDFHHEFFRFMTNPPIFGLIIWTILTPILKDRKILAWTYPTIAISLILCGLTALKYGGVINYYMPLLVIALGICSPILKNPPQMLAFLFTVAVLSLPIKIAHTAHYRWHGAWKLSTEETKTLGKIVEAHKSNKILTEDAFFSVLSGSQPLVSDTFQFGVVTERTNKNLDGLLAKTRRIFGNWRLRRILGEEIDKQAKTKVSYLNIRDVQNFLVEKAPDAAININRRPFENKEIAIRSFINCILISSILFCILTPLSLSTRFKNNKY